MDGTKFECMIRSKVEVIDRMKVQNVTFSPKRGMLKFRTRLGKKVKYIYVKRRKASVMVTLVAFHE